MKSKVILSIFCIVGTLSMVTATTAGEVSWILVTDSSFVGKGPGPDGIIGAAGTPAATDDTADATNTWGTATVTAYEYENPGPSCPAVPGTHDAVSYVMNSEFKLCLGDPSPGQFRTTALTQSFSALPGGWDLTVRLTAGGGPNTGSPCPLVGDANMIYDLDVVIGGIKWGEVDDFPDSGRVYLMSDNTPEALNCQTADARNTGYTQEDLLGIKGLLPPDATAYWVYCNRSQQPDDPFSGDCFVPGPWTTATGVVYTTDDVNACDAVCGSGGGCMAATAENVD